VLLSATLLAGWLFGEQLYGAAGALWKWDHKTVFSVLSWLAFATLAGRALPVGLARAARRALCSTSAPVLLLLAYAGSRFVLEVVLGRAIREGADHPAGRAGGGLALAQPSARRACRPRKTTARAPRPSGRHPAGDGALRRLRACHLPQADAHAGQHGVLLQRRPSPAG
jgi:hypothetical protein